MPRASFADIATDWERLLTTVVNNKDDLQNLEPFRAQLEIELTGAKAASIQQGAAQAIAQQATRDLEGFLERGKDLANQIRTGIISRYGRRSEKLTEFRLKPLRPRKKPAASAVKQPPKTPTGKVSAEPSAQEEVKPAPQDSTTTGPSQ